MIIPFWCGMMFFTRSYTSMMLSCLVTSSSNVVTRSDVVCSRSMRPLSVKHAAITWTPLISSCLVSSLPKPVSHPVINTYLVVDKKREKSRLEQNKVHGFCSHIDNPGLMTSLHLHTGARRKVATLPASYKDITWTPLASSCLVSSLPKPVSHPVINTYLVVEKKKRKVD